MKDILQGPVIRVIDGDTFDLRVIHVGVNNQNDYKDEERIRIANIDAPELRSPGGSRSRDLLVRRLNGREVKCFVEARDTYGRLVADVTILGEALVSQFTRS